LIEIAGVEQAGEIIDDRKIAVADHTCL
jgi:hypothetical protein